MVKKINNLSPGVKASIGFFISSLITSGIAYITTPIYTRLLTTDEYGQVSIFLTWLQIFGILAMFCLSYGIFNNGMVNYPEKRDEYSFSMLILSNIITLCFAAILFCLYPLIKTFIKIDWPFLILMIIVFLTQPAYNFWAARQRYELKYKWTLFWSVISAFLSPLVAIICIVCSSGTNNVYPRIFGAEITLIIIYILFYFYILIKNKGKINTSYWKEALLFNLPLIPHYLSSYLLSSSDKIMISYLIDDTATAFYSVAHSVAAVALIVWSAINASLIPYTYEKCKEKDYNSINRVTLPLIAIFACGCLLVILLAPEVVRVMATIEYTEAIYVIPPIVGGVFFQVQYYIYANIVYYYKKPAFVMIGSISAVTLNIILNYIFIQKYGYQAAGYTTIACYFLQAVIDYFAMKKVVKEKVYNMKFIILLSLIVIVLAVFSPLIYDLLIVRYIILLALLLMLFILRKRIYSIFSLMKEKE